MSANPEFLESTAKVDEAAIKPLPNSRKVYVQGSRPDIQVPMREVSQADTPDSFGGEKNPAVYVYDTSGPYTDPNAKIDIRSGLEGIRSPWIEERGDTEVLAGPTSHYGQERLGDPKLAELRFNLTRQPRRAKAGKNVTEQPPAKVAPADEEALVADAGAAADEDDALPEVEDGAAKTLRVQLAVASSPRPMSRPEQDEATGEAVAAMQGGIAGALAEATAPTDEGSLEGQAVAMAEPQPLSITAAPAAQPESLAAAAQPQPAARAKANPCRHTFCVLGAFSRAAGVQHCEAPELFRCPTCSADRACSAPGKPQCMSRALSTSVRGQLTLSSGETRPAC